VTNAMLLAAAMTIGMQAAPVQTPATSAETTPVQDQAAAQRRRNQIQIMEGVLTRAVRSGAEDLARRMQSRDPSLMLFTGQARARGFLLEQYGVFFDVEIPALRPTVVWSMQALQRDSTIANAIDSLRQALMSLPDSPRRLEAEQALKYVQQLGPAVAAKPQGQASQRPVTAANADPLDDPHSSYTDAVKNALIDAMLDYSLAMDLRPDEWLTVAARDSEGPLTPDEIYDPTTIVISVKGSDLASYAADRSKRSEVKSRVVVREF
jgi:hypothetical protein